MRGTCSKLFMSSAIDWVEFYLEAEEPFLKMHRNREESWL
jgi:hypothetical protein